MICDSSAGESQEELSIPVICVGHSDGCALDIVECQSRKQFLVTDSTLVSGSVNYISDS